MTDVIEPELGAQPAGGPDLELPDPTWRGTWPIEGPPQPAKLAIGVRMREMPTDGFFAFTVPGYDAASTIVFPAPPAGRSPIYKSDLSVLVTVDWRASFDTSITVSWWRGATDPPPGASITPIVAYAATDGESIETFPDSLLELPPRPEVVRVDELAVKVF